MARSGDIFVRILVRKCNLIIMSKHHFNDTLRANSVSAISKIGSIVAEKDKNLIEYYVAKEKYVDRAMSFDDHAVFFVGPKGAGKSAILQMVRLLKHDDNDRVINISPDDLAFSALANVQAETPLIVNAGQNQHVFRSLWDYVLSIEILKKEFHERTRLLSTVLSFFRGPERNEAERLVKMSVSDDGTPYTLSDRILQLINEIELSGDIHGVKVTGLARVGESPHSRQLKLLALVNSVAKNLRQVINRNYHVLIDDLDTNWNDTITQNAFLAALFASLKKLNNDKVKFVVALRERIYTSLPLDDKDKHRESVSYVEWDRPSVEEMIAKRLAFTLKITPDEIWGGLFPEGSTVALWRRTTGQPREMLRLALVCLEMALREGHRKVEQGDIGLAVTKFSKEKIEDLGSELTYKYRGFYQLIMKLHGCAKQFPMRKIEDIALEVAAEFDPKPKNQLPYEWAKVYIDDPVGLARIFLETGVCQYKVNRTAPPEDFTPDKPQPITSQTWLAVHPMFTPGLQCVGD